MIVRCLIALTFCAAVIGGAGVDAQERAADDWISDVIRHQRTGNLEAAWDALVVFHGHRGRDNIHIELFSECFIRPACPSIGDLGALLGKSVGQAGGLEPFCPDWSSFFAPLLDTPDPFKRAEYEDMMDLVRTRGLGGSCAEWRKREAAKLHANPVEQPALGPQIVPLGTRAHENGTWPTVNISIAGNTTWAIADSGSSFTWLSSFDSPLARYLDDATTLYASTVHNTTRSGRHYEERRVNSVGLGDHDFREIVINLPVEQPHVDVGYVLGMNVFLRYPSVCFDWVAERLHLGETGPCTGGAGGALVDGARLLGNFVIVVEIPTSDGTSVKALFDTGALGTVCSEAFVELNGGVDAFRFGRHAALAAECATIEPGPPMSPGNFQILIGLDTFRRFDAFGWELNPLRVYFVPKDMDN